MAARIAAAARETGIGLTLLPSFYAYGGFGGAAAHRRASGASSTIRTGFSTLVARAARDRRRPAGRARRHRAAFAARGDARDACARVCAAMPDGPIHIHAAEQTKEVEDCIAALGARPVQWLLDNAGVDARWCLIHATHMTEDETRALAASGAVAGCARSPRRRSATASSTARDYLAAGGRFGIGTDSNIQIDAAAELRQLEYGQRLARRARNVMTHAGGRSRPDGGCSPASLAGGAQALRRPIGALAVGSRADIVLLDGDHPDLGVAAAAMPGSTAGSSSPDALR